MSGGASGGTGSSGGGTGPLISFRDCRIGNPLDPALPSISWEMLANEVWIVTGPNGGGKSAFAAALAGAVPVEAPEGGPPPRNRFAGRTMLVSFEAAAALIARERANDDSDFVEGGVDEGRSVRAYVAEALPAASTAEERAGIGLEAHPAVVACGIAPYLDRGLKRLSTGEIRRTLLARALAAEPELLVLDEPYEGLDAASRITLAAILEGLAAGRRRGPTLVLVADRWEHIPAAANRVAELRDRRIAFSGERAAYEALVEGRRAAEAAGDADERAAVESGLASAGADASFFLNAVPADSLADGTAAAADRPDGAAPASAPLIEFRSATVEWSGRKVIDGLDWTVRPGEHWLIRGPNGSGKTTILELITGDNPQVFRNEIFLFGKRRGSGESIWELKERMGIVSYRLHLEYRYLDDSSLEEVLVSGLHDSIGLYRQVGDAERLLARRWLDLALFSGRGGERFGRLSFGEQRALLVARAAIKGPPLLILDEPCHGLDETHRGRVLKLLEAVAARGRSTLLFVTHDPAEVLPCIRRVLELRPGESPMWSTTAL